MKNIAQLIGGGLCAAAMLLLCIRHHLQRFQSDASLTERSLWDATDGEPVNAEARELCRRWGECADLTLTGEQLGDTNVADMYQVFDLKGEE